MTVGVKERRVRNFMWSMEIKWFGFTGYHELPDGRMVKIRLETYGTRGEYERFYVRLFYPVSDGIIDECMFYFADYLEWPEERRKAYAGERICISAYLDYRWNGEPVSTRPICAAIEEWIGMYRSGEDDE